MGWKSEVCFPEKLDFQASFFRRGTGLECHGLPSFFLLVENLEYQKVVSNWKIYLVAVKFFGFCLGNKYVCLTFDYIKIQFVRMFPSYPWTSEWLHRHCWQRFNVTPQPTTLAQLWGFDSTNLARSTSRIVFVNGLNDGWSVGGILHSLSVEFLGVSANFGTSSKTNFKYHRRIQVNKHDFLVRESLNLDQNGLVKSGQEVSFESCLLRNCVFR